MPETIFYKKVFETIADGAIVLSAQGEIVMFNAAAASILGIAQEQALGKSFAQVFLMCREENDEFSQIVMDSVYNPGKEQHKSVPFVQEDDTQIFLDIKASYLYDKDNHETKSVIVVFSDITELRRILEEEKALTRKLGDAYQELESRTETLKGQVEKRKLVRRVALGFVLLLLVGLGIFVATVHTDFSELLSTEPDTLSEQAGTTLVLEPQPLKQYIILSGQIEPLEEVIITSPFSGHLVERYVSYGQEVPEDTPLLRLDEQELMVKLREAQTNLIKAQQEHDKLLHWKESDEVASANRTLVKAKNSLESLQRKLDVNKKLFEQGIIPEEEYDSALESYESQQLDFNSAKESLETAQEKGDEKNLNIASLSLENARYQYESLKSKKTKNIITAPVKGVVIKPRVEGEAKNQNLEVGARFEEGNILLAIGNLEGLSIKSKIDELDVLKIRIGQKAVVSGDAFQGTELTGKVSQISSQALSNSNGGAAMFEITVAIKNLTEETMQQIRLGMVVKMRIKVYENPSALLIPINAVLSEPDGRYYVLCRHKNEDSSLFEKCPLLHGKTTAEAVEILDGLAAGDSIQIPQ